MPNDRLKSCFTVALSDVRGKAREIQEKTALSRSGALPQRHPLESAQSLRGILGSYGSTSERSVCRGAARDTPQAQELDGGACERRVDAAERYDLGQHYVDVEDEVAVVNEHACHERHIMCAATPEK